MPKKASLFFWKNMPNIQMLFGTGWVCIDPTNSVAKETNLPRFLHIVDLMPEVDRDILLAWREYRIKLKEYQEKTKALRDSLDANKPRFIN